MKAKLSIFFPILFFSCSSNDLKINDLKFNDTEKRGIRNNGILESVISYDTARLNLSMRFPYFCKFGQGTEIIKYDKYGNIIYHKVREFMGISQSFEYDSLQLLTRKIYVTDYKAEFLVKNIFDGKNRKLFQIWTYGDLIDTTRFVFDESGYLQNESGQFHDDISIRRTYSKEYLYEEDKLYKTVTVYPEGQKYLIKKEENLSYKNGMLHKIEIVYDYSSTEKNNDYPMPLKLVKEFDEKGLPVRLVETNQNNNTIIKLIKNK
jgi:hypothetical protein